MTEKETWEYLEKLWRKPLHSQVRNWRAYVLVNDRRCEGLCDCLAHVNVGSHLYEQMMDKIRSNNKGLVCSFMYPLTLAGAKKRANFCKEQANGLRSVG